MSMSDEQFQEDTEALRRGGYVSFVDDLRARDTAQREVLARVEAERDVFAKRLCICHVCGGRGEVHTGEYTNEGQWQPPEPVMVECGECGGDGKIGQVTDLDAALAERDTAKAQLAEAVGLLWFIQGYLEEGQDSNVKSKIRSFISRHRLDEHAQAEQQEAQGAQAGDERAAFESYALKACGPYFDKPEDCLRRDGDYYVYGQVVTSWNAWRARAALATQPAEWVEPVVLASAGPIYDQGFADGVSEAKRLNAVRGAEHE